VFVPAPIAVASVFERAESALDVAVAVPFFMAVAEASASARETAWEVALAFAPGSVVVAVLWAKPPGRASASALAVPPSVSSQVAVSVPPSPDMLAVVQAA
jgi:hypothetical protein